MKRYLLSLSLLSVFLFTGCIDKEKEKMLDLREKALTEKEKLFSQKESEYQSLLKMRDSIFAKKDSTMQKIWPDSITGIWSGKTICTESNCNEYAIGDVRTENWDFTNDDSHLLSKVSNKGKLVRTYMGKYENEKILLDYNTDSTSKKKVQMNIVLDDISANKIKGSRVITVDNNCTAKFTIELSRNNNKDYFR